MIFLAYLLNKIECSDLMKVTDKNSDSLAAKDVKKIPALFQQIG